MQPRNRLTEGRALCRTVSRIELGLFHPAQKRIGHDADRTSSLFKCPVRQQGDNGLFLLPPEFCTVA